MTQRVSGPEEVRSRFEAQLFYLFKFEPLTNSEDAVRKRIGENLNGVEERSAHEFCKNFFLARFLFRNTANFTRSKIPTVGST